MRSLFYVVFIAVLAHLAASKAVAAAVDSGQADLSSKFNFIVPHSLSVIPTQESRNRFLRVVETADDAMTTTDEERAVNSSPTSKMAEKFKTTSVGKKLIANAKKAINVLKKIPGVGTIKKMRLYNKYSRWFKKGLSADDAKKAGLITSHDDFLRYGAFITAAKAKKAAV